jgi:hypothetical protein
LRRHGTFVRLREQLEPAVDIAAADRLDGERALIV